MNHSLSRIKIEKLTDMGKLNIMHSELFVLLMILSVSETNRVSDE